ncbi:MAG: lytic transglycosylase domain-containing protein [Elusimicrobiota bacterium]|jgi:hypothetical protein
MRLFVSFLCAFSLGTAGSAYAGENVSSRAFPLLSAVSAFYDGGVFRAAQLPRIFDHAGMRGMIGPAERSSSPSPDAAVKNAVGTGSAVVRLSRSEQDAKQGVLLSDVVDGPPPPSCRNVVTRLLQTQAERVDGYNSMIIRYARKYNLDPRLLKAIIAAESEFHRKAVSPAGARGLMQLMPETAEEMGVSRGLLFDPEQNIRAGAAYLAQLFSRILRAAAMPRADVLRAPMWVVQRVLAAYNAGPRFLFKSRCSRQISGYVRKVLFYYRSKIADFTSGMGDWIPRADGEKVALFYAGSSIRCRSCFPATLRPRACSSRA